MATIKARYPTWFPQEPAIGGLMYSSGVCLGKMISVSVSPEYQQASALGGGRRIFISAAVALNTSQLTFEAYKSMFGGAGANGELSDLLGISKRGGLAYITGEQEDGHRFWRVHLLRDVIFIPPSESAVTFNGQVTFTTPSLSGTAWPDYIAGKWRERKDFNALAVAEAALNLIDSNGGLTG